MGTWGTGIFEDDMALDVRNAFEDALATGATLPEATDQVLEQFADALDDTDDRPVVYLALAALQLERGAVQPEIQEKALVVRQRSFLVAWCWESTRKLR